MAEPVQPRHAEGIVPHDMHGVRLLIKQDLPAFIKRLHAEGGGGHIADLDIRLRRFDAGGLAPGSG